MDMEASEELINLSNAIEEFYKDKKQLDIYKKSTDEYNKQIKSFMTTLNMSEFETGNGIVAKISISKNESFNEDMLLDKLKELGMNDVIKTKEYVDMDLLEDAIYNGKVNAAELANCRITKEIIKLIVKEKK